MPTRSIEVREMSQAGQVRRAAAVFAEQMGFNAEDTGRVGLVATEAATNLVKHAQGGEIVLTTVQEPEARAVEIVALDHGPGIRDMDIAMRDGFSTAGSLGGGLGAIRRNSSCFDLYSGDLGTILFARVGAPGGPTIERSGRAATGGAGGSIEVGAVQVPCPGEEVSGDSWAVANTPHGIAILVVDGLGHGVEAHEAAALTTRVFEYRAEEAPASILQYIHESLRATRGAAAAVLKLDLRDRSALFAGIGNISASVRAKGESRSMVSHHGVLGHAVRKFHEFVYPWPPRSLVVLHTDGIGTHWDLARYPGLEQRRPALIAAALYRDFTRRRDDATVIALREAA
jgi:anti-sigma regulatory factor (Ser/Thr protein kinase)